MSFEEKHSRLKSVAGQRLPGQSSPGSVLVFSAPPGGALDPDGALVAGPPIASTLGAQVTISLTAAEINALNATPQLLIPAPGANSVNIVTQIAAYLTAGTAAFVGGTGITANYGTTPSSANQAFPTNIDATITSAVDAMDVSVAANSISTQANSVATTNYFNQPIYLTASEAITGSGNGTLALLVNYVTYTYIYP